MKKGLIALDIDGTITDEKASVPRNVITNLSELDQQGWQIILLTGRTFSFATPIMNCFSFPLYGAFQNGSVAMKWPSKELLYKRYLEQPVYRFVEQHMQDLEAAMGIYTGFENQDHCYWKENAFLKQHQAYIEEISSREKQVEKIVHSFDLNELKKAPLIKCVGSFESMTLLATRLLSEKKFAATIVKDPFTADFYFLLITSAEVSKGHIIELLKKKFHYEYGTIAAGNDDNDISMLKVADIAIVMSNAPKHMLKLADYIAPPAAEEGIITALKLAVAKRVK